MKLKPNILLIMCDQLRYDCLTSNIVKTPNFDRLRNRGVSFTNAYSQTPVCIPARHSLISGQNAFEIGLNENSLNRKEIRYPLPRIIRDLGYYTCAVGKMHFVPVREHFGFDHMYLSEEIPSHIEDDEYLKYLRDEGYGHVIEPHGKRSKTYYVPQISELPKEVHTTAWTANKTIDVIEKNKNRPFFIFSSFIKPHPPFDPCKPYHEMYDVENMPLPIQVDEIIDDAILVQNGYKVDGIDKLSDYDKKKIKAYYYASVTQVDEYIGKILDCLEENNLWENTLVVLTADHGEMLGDHNGYGKRTYYEESAKIPFVLSYPKVFKQGVEVNSLAKLPDIYATIIKAAGGEVPEISCGVDLTDVCTMENTYTRDCLYAQYGFGRRFKAMIRWDKYKYIYMANGRREFLFDLEKDPLELNPIKDEEVFSEKRKELCKYFEKYGLEVPGYEYDPPVVGSFLDQTPRWHLR